jgi:succinate dehydrogenase assembly factor 1
MVRLSGLQREVLSLYRKCLREIRQKPPVGHFSPFVPDFSLIRVGIKKQFQELCTVGLHPGISPILPLRLRRPRAEFRKHLSVNKKDFGAIEYLLRKGHRQLEMYASPGIRNIR